MDGPLLVFDGDCGFCTTSAHWIEAQWSGAERAVAWQQLGREGLARLGLTEEQVSQAVYWIDATGRISAGAAAVGHTLAAGDKGWRAVGRLLLIPPVTRAAQPVYRLVARYRHKLPGATDACRL